MSELTIAIPTYNRNSQLAATVSVLVPQLKDNVKIKIFDNGSDIPVTATLPYYEKYNIEIVRSDINIGAAGNIIKCFEYCDSDLLWVLGDDDLPGTDAIELILVDFSKHQDVIFIKYDSNLCEYSGFTEGNVFSVGQVELIDNLKSFANFLFLSSGVYRAHEIKKNLKSAYYFASTFCPHVAILLDYIRVNNRARVLFSSSSIVEWKAPVQQNHKWGDEIVNKSVHDLLYIIEDDKARSTLFHKMNFDHSYHYIKAKDTIKLYIVSNSKERYDLIADYFSSYSFVSWVSRWKINNVFFNFIKMSLLLYVCEFRFVANIMQYHYRRREKGAKSIYNRFLHSVREIRL
jgi:glycosyltransferase involved in cell wall biosynthesis